MKLSGIGIDKMELTVCLGLTITYKGQMGLTITYKGPMGSIMSGE